MTEAARHLIHAQELFASMHDLQHSGARLRLSLARRHRKVGVIFYRCTGFFADFESSDAMLPVSRDRSLECPDTDQKRDWVI